MERSRYPPKAFITFLGVIFTSVIKPLPINNNYIADIYSINIEKTIFKTYGTKQSKIMKKKIKRKKEFLS